MKLFECTVDDGTVLYKTLTASNSKKELLNEYGGYVKFEKITDVTKEYNTISVSMLKDTLRNAGYGQGEIVIITALLEKHNKQFQ